MRSAVFLFLVACHVAPPAGGTCPPASARATLGDTTTIASRVLGERRVINIYTPPGYDKSTDRYPVLYMPDGGMNEDFPHVVGSVDVSIKNGIIRPIIVVGIQNTERRRDLVAPTEIEEEKKIAPHAGGSDRFRAFLRDELRPWVAGHYRTTAETAIVGESFAGLFVMETLLVEPTLFDGYIAADPSVIWNDEHLVKGAGIAFAGWSAGARQLYVATADYPPTQHAIATLLDAARAHQPGGLTWTYEPMPDEHHSTIFPTAALHGIRVLFAAPSP